MYQHSQHAPIHSSHVQELMTDWTSSISSMGNRAEKECVFLTCSRSTEGKNEC